jgi:hypothetical protein
MAHGRALEVWYDGQCPVCRASRDWCATRDPEGRLEFRDVRAVAETELPVSRADAEASMWVRGADGALAAGFAGWRRILAEPAGAGLRGSLEPLHCAGSARRPTVVIARARRLLPGTAVRLRPLASATSERANSPSRELPAAKVVSGSRSASGSELPARTSAPFSEVIVVASPARS